MFPREINASILPGDGNLSAFNLSLLQFPSHLQFEIGLSPPPFLLCDAMRLPHQQGEEGSLSRTKTPVPLGLCASSDGGAGENTLGSRDIDSGLQSNAVATNPSNSTGLILAGATPHPRLVVLRLL